MTKEVDDLLRQLPTGCKVKYVSDPLAIEFIEKVTELKRQGKEPNLERASEILIEEWDIDIPRRALSSHIRGKCSCQKK